MVFNRSLLRAEAGRFLISLSLVCSPIVAIVGDTQRGKSTFCFWLASEICRIKHALGLWKEPYWDYKKLCAKSFDDFRGMVRDNNHSVVAVEEAGTQLDSDEWWKLENKLYNKIAQTQAYKRNVYMLVCPSSHDIAKKHRATLTMMFSVERKILKRRRAVVKPNFIKKRHWLLKDKNFSQVWLNQIVIQYDAKFLKEAKKYTDWLEKYKENIMDDIDTRYDDHQQRDKIKLKRPRARTGKPLKINY